ncbi:MAG: DUF3772 domain-containing protein [Rhodobacter sp.]|nr:DUF3772 domain-containing protein [Rhodobacter sp.]
MRQLLARLLLALSLGAAWLAPQDVLAQSQEAAEAIDYEAWDAVAVRAENATSAARASNEAFESLRAEVVVWRERLLRAQDVNSARIETLRSQIEALGPPPEEGLTEAEEIAARRSALNAQLAEALAPVTAAVEAFSRAEGLVREIDMIIRERQADALLRLGPTPLNPVLWPEAITELLTSLRGIQTEVAEAWRSDAKRDTFREDLPLTLLYLVIAAILLVRGRAVMERMTVIVLNRSKGRARWLAGFVTSLGQIVVPVVGLVLLVEAVETTGMIGLRGQAVADALPAFGICFFGARWLGLRLYPVREDAPRRLPATPEQARSMRWYATSLGLIVGLAIILGNLADYEDYAPAVDAVLFFPIVALAGLIVLRVGQILTRASWIDDTGEEPSFGARGQRLAGRAAFALGLVGPVMAAIGYLNAGVYLTFPAAISLALFGLLLILHDLIVELYAVAVRKTHDEAREALLPILFSFVMVLAALPLFALIWGARVSDLTELWAQFREGFTLGDTRISPQNFLTFAVVFAGFFVATRLIQGALKSSVLPKTGIDTGGQTAIVSGVGYIGIFLAALIAITTAGIDLSGIAIVAGALSVGIGFGLQNIVSNFVSGIILLIERPVAEGDWIEVGGQMGIVKDISVRSTRIETFDKNDVIVPNADFISGAVKNWTRGNVIGRIIVPVGVAYGTDTRKVERILKEIAMEHPLVALNPEPGVDFLEFGASSLDFQIRAVLRDINFGLSVRTEIRHRIAERFAEEGIEIPFAQQDIWLRNPETLTGAKPLTALPSGSDEPEEAPAPAEPQADQGEGVMTEDDAPPEGDLTT